LDRTSRGTVLPFFLLTYAVMWASFFTVALARVPVSSPLGIVLLRLGAYAPSLVAIWLTARAAGGGGVINLLSGVFKWRVPARYYVLAVAFIPVIKLTAALLQRLTSGTWPRMGSESLLLIPLAIAFSTPFQAGEEIGWRGYALPRLADRFGLRAASLLLGFIWALWHLPQFFIRDAAEFGQSFPLYVLQVTALGVAFAWLYARTHGSLLLVMLLHAATNNAKDIFPSATPGATNSFGVNASLLAWLTVALLWIAAGYFLVSMPKWTPTTISSPSSSSSLS